MSKKEKKDSKIKRKPHPIKLNITTATKLNR